MQTMRLWHGIVVAHKKVYAIFGNYGNGSIEFYDFSYNRWTYATQMDREITGSVSATYLNNAIYITTMDEPTIF